MRCQVAPLSCLSPCSRSNLKDEYVIVIDSFSSENDEEIVREFHEFVNTDTASVEPEDMLAGLAGTSSSGSEDGEVVREVGEVKDVNDIIGVGHDHHDIEEEVFCGMLTFTTHSASTKTLIKIY